MKVQQTIRWQQRFNNYRKALVKLTQAVELLSGQFDREEAVDELLQEGLIQRFEYTHELAWKVMKIMPNTKAIPMCEALVMPSVRLWRWA